MQINRDRYLEQLKNKRENGRIKIITGIRRCGKSYILNVLFRASLLSTGVREEQIIALSLDDDANMSFRNPIRLSQYLREAVANSKVCHYLLLDEIQKVVEIPNPYLPANTNEKIGFVDVLLGLNKLPNVDIYVTGSNSKMLSSDIVTEFRDRGDEIRINPLTFDEFYKAYTGEKRHAWREFITYGGMPYAMQLTTHQEKSKYLQDLFSITYIKDVVERNHIRGKIDTLNDLLNFVASSVGSLTNPNRLANTLKSTKHIDIKNETISAYLEHFIDAFILSKSYRYDIKGKSYINTPLKYYFTDIGLRNALLNFRQQEENHMMENVIYNELIDRGFNVDVGVIEFNHKEENGEKKRALLEVDFVVNKAEQRYYIQSAWTIADEAKRMQEVNSLNRIDDSFTKIVVVKDDILPWVDEQGVRYTNIEDFLLKAIDNL
jgi:predicted AAA+ superfamily ATPase